ncbi:peptidoglycan-binding domain-containing protein [Lentzea terrae]|uniref:peptidoglycan-binding domain-containing protein n=1 Tax=Lentzea terrae TaxID=2200761 RepID=UPI0018E55B44|nr:peptidoglycan-binding domain-containing protein [Lentzea terrae]
MKWLLRKSAIGLAMAAVGAVTFAVPAAGADLATCSGFTSMNRGGHIIHVPTVKGSSSCQMGRDYAVADKKVVHRFQLGLKSCYAKLNLASPYSDEKIESIDADGSFGPRTEAALKAVQRHTGADVDGIYGPNTRDHIKFLAADGRNCYAY